MMVSKKAFASIIVLLFLLIFLSITIQNKQNTLSDFIILKQVETKKENEYLNFEKVILNSLNNCQENPIIIKEQIVMQVNNFTKDKEYFIINDILKKEENINLFSLNNIIRINVYKPYKKIIIKEVYLTNGINNDKSLSFKINTRNYSSTFIFPKNYFLRKVVFC